MIEIVWLYDESIINVKNIRHKDIIFVHLFFIKLFEYVHMSNYYKNNSHGFLNVESIRYQYNLMFVIKCNFPTESSSIFTL